MATRYSIRSKITLAILLTKNQKPITGAVVSVRVIKVLDGTEELASTPLVEQSEPGLYSFKWTNPPEEITDLLALYLFKNDEFSENIEIKKEIPDIIIGTLKAKISSDQILRADISKDQKIGVSIQKEQIIKVGISDDETLAAKIKSDKINAETGG